MTLQDVQDAMHALQEAGVVPSLNKILAQIGHGSKRDVYRFMQILQANAEPAVTQASPAIIAEDQHPLMQSLAWDDKVYFTSRRLHRDYLRNTVAIGDVPKYRRHDNYVRVIFSMPNFNILIDQKDILVPEKGILNACNDSRSQNLSELLQPFFAANQGQRLVFLNATAQLELAHHLDDLLNQETAYRHSRQGAAINLAEAFLRKRGFLTYRSLYEFELFKEFCRVWGVKIPSNDKHWPGCGKLMNDFIYGIFPEETQQALEIQRSKYKHMEFRDDRRFDTLKQRETQILALLRLCDNGEKETFIGLLERHDRRIGLEVQITAKVIIRLSTIASNQLTLF